MRTKVFILAVLLGISMVLSAQQEEKRPERIVKGQKLVLPVNQRQRGPGYALNLTDEQKEALKQSNLAMQKQLQPVRNELGEAEAHQRTLMTAENPDLKAINKNLEKIGELKTEIAKIAAKHRLEMRSKLTDEQRLKFDMQKGNMMRGNRDMAGRPGRNLPARGK